MSGNDTARTRATPTSFGRGQSVGGGRFKLLRPVGRGVMGETWLAEDGVSHESVALKFLFTTIRGDVILLEALRRDVSRSKILSHPNIVRIHELIEDGPLAFIVMEHVDGQTLATERLDASNHLLSWDYLEPLVVQACRALVHAHSEKVVHGNLKPSNIIVDSAGAAKLADFCITRVNNTMNACYSSPQLLDSDQPRVADDIYALGATLFELLTSTPPFYTGDIAHQVRHSVAPQIADRLAEFRLSNNVPHHVSALIDSCLRKEPGARPQSAAAVLERLQNSEPDNSRLNFFKKLFRPK